MLFLIVLLLSELTSSGLSFFGKPKVLICSGERLSEVTTMEKGILVIRGKVVEPPYILRQEANKVLINEEMVYPFPRVEKPAEKPEEAEVSEYKVPDKIKEVLQDFRKSWGSGLVKDEKDLVKKAAGLEREEKDLIRDASGAVIDADAFIQDYESQKKALEQVLESEKIPFEETKEYHDVLIPVEKGWGVVALFNEAERIKIAEKIAKKRPVARTFPYKEAAKFKQYIEAGLKKGDMLILDDDSMEYIPHEMVDDAAKEISGFDALAIEDKAEALADKLALRVGRGRRRPRPRPHVPLKKSAVIFFPHLFWQWSIFGRHSHYPVATLPYMLMCERYRVRVYYDMKVTLARWERFLKNGQTDNLRVIYNEGHGDVNAIYVGEPYLLWGWYYFTDQFVYQHAKLKKTIAFIHSCLTFLNYQLANAFLNRGARLYAGWRYPTPAHPGYCDYVDHRFWGPLCQLDSTTGYACANLSSFDPDFGCKGDMNLKLL